MARARHSTRRHGPKASKKLEGAMHELKRATRRSGGSGEKAITREQAIAIGLAVARRGGDEVPPNPYED